MIQASVTLMPGWLIAFGWIAATLAAYGLGLGLRRLARGSALANPVLIAIALIVGLLLATGTTYADYVRATWPITFLLGPATVALGLPVAETFPQVKRSLGGVLAGLAAGCLASMISGVLLVRLLGGTPALMLSILPKAATTPIAIEVAREIGGLPALTAALGILGGITAAVTLQAVLRLLRIGDWRAVGLAAGTAGSGIGAARVSPLSPTAAAFAAIGIGVNGLLTALLAPTVSQIAAFCLF